MVYRPTVRYADDFKEYVDDLFHATTLDRNQIMRAALFSAAFSPNFELLLKQYKKADVSLPPPKWNADQHGFWLDRNPPKQKGGKDVNVNIRTTNEIERTAKSVTGPSECQEQGNRCEPQITRRERQVSSERIIRNKGGITIKIG
ncbi:hypothetical protein QFZ72_005998 [Bacillus sp. V2I10]|nr:hypothetical protein [Bacillus sp. V2I10]